MFNFLKYLIMNDWVKVSDKLPERLSTKLVFGRNEYGKNRILRAVFVPKFTMSEDEREFSGDCDYNEEKDEYFWPEGWYEWNDCEEIHWKITFSITHWMDLPEYPN